MMSRHSLNLFAGSLVVLASLGAHAATQGSVGPTSTGTVLINVTKGALARISGLTDISFGAATTSPSKTSIDACIYSSSGSYTITATSANGSGSNFRMSDPSQAAFVLYSVEWNNGATGSSGSSLTHSTTSSVFANANSTQEDCGGGRNSRLFVEVNSASFSAAPASTTYTDTLTLVVAPN